MSWNWKDYMLKVTSVIRLIHSKWCKFSLASLSMTAFFIVDKILWRSSQSTAQYGHTTSEVHEPPWWECLRKIASGLTWRLLFKYTFVMIYHCGTSLSKQHNDLLCTKQDLSHTSRYVDESSPEIARYHIRMPTAKGQLLSVWLHMHKLSFTLKLWHELNFWYL